MLQVQVVLVLRVFFCLSLLAFVERNEKPGRWLQCVLIKAILKEAFLMVFDSDALWHFNALWDDFFEIFWLLRWVLLFEHQSGQIVVL